MSREIKLLLKDAKRCLDEEKFQEAITLCKQILSADENCYNALVIYGAALFGSGKLQDACKELEHAISIDANSSLAWQGLGKVYESDKMLSRLKRTKICEVYRKLCGFYSTSDGDWMKLAKSKSLLAKALVFDFGEVDLSKEDTSVCIERLTEAKTMCQDIWVLASKHEFSAVDFSSIFSVFIDQLRRMCAVENGNVVFEECCSLLRNVYLKLFQLESNSGSGGKENIPADDRWVSLVQTLAPQDLSLYIDECVTLVVRNGFLGDTLEAALWHLIQINATPKVLLVYCQLLLEKHLTQPQLAKLHQLTSDEQSVLKLEYKKQTGSRTSAISKYESDSIHLIFGSLALYEGNKSRALEELTAISNPQHPLIFLYLAKAYLECGLPAEAVAASLQGLKLCSADPGKKTAPSLFSCFFDKRIVSTELEALRVLALLESGTEPSYASLVQEVDDLISQEAGTLTSDIMAYVAGRLHASSLSKTKHNLQIRDIRRKLEIEMRHCISSGKPDEALEIFDKSNVPGVEDDIFLLTVESLACSYFNETNTEILSRGTTSATRALAIAPTYALAHWAMGRCLYKIKQASEAEQHLAEASSSQPLNSSIAYDYCKILFNSQRHEECAAVVSRLVSVSSPCQWPYIRLALYHLEQKNPNVAIHLLLAALRCPSAVSEAVDGTSLDANASNSTRLNTLWRCLGLAYTMKGSLASATRALNHCATLSPSGKFDTTSACSLSEAYLRLGRTEAVVRCLEEESDPCTSGAVNIRKFIQIATAELQLAKSYTSQCADCVAAKCMKVLTILFERTSPQFWNIVLFWKCAGDAALLLADAAEHIPPASTLKMSEKVIGLLKLSSPPVDQKDWLTLACRFYSTAIRINGNLPQLWSDLAVTRSRLAINKDANDKKLTILAAFVSAQLVSCQSAWCNLGLICTMLGKFAPGQHFLLSSLPYAGQSPLLFVSLGLLYILTENLRLADEVLSYARNMIEAGCVESVTRPNILPALQICEASLKATSPINMKQLVDLVQLALALPLPTGLRCKIAVYGIMLRKMTLYFSQSTVAQRNSKLSCKILFEQTGQLVNNSLLLADKAYNDSHIVKSLLTIAGLCGHVVELTPGDKINWKLSARLFQKACGRSSPEEIAFWWHKIRAQCLASISCEDDLCAEIDKMSPEFGARGLLLECLSSTKSSTKMAEAIAKASSAIQGTEFAVASGLGYVLCKHYAAAKEHLLKILIGLKSKAQDGKSQEEQTFEWRLLNILGKIAVITRDIQLYNVVLSLSGPSFTSNLFKLLCDPRKDDCKFAAAFVHTQPFRVDVWQFALRHLMANLETNDQLSEKQTAKIKAFVDTAISHLPAKDAYYWRAIASRYVSPTVGLSGKRIFAAIHAKPFEAGVWALLAADKNNLVQNTDAIKRVFHYHKGHTKTVKISFSESTYMR